MKETKIFLDSCYLIAVQREKNKDLLKEFHEITQIYRIATSQLNIIEVERGIHYVGKIHPEYDWEFMLKRFRTSIQNVEILPITQDVIDKYCTTYATLKKSGKLIESMDLVIGSIAAVHNLITITNNTRHFQHFSELTLIDYVDNNMSIKDKIVHALQ